METSSKAASGREVSRPLRTGGNMKVRPAPRKAPHDYIAVSLMSFRLAVGAEGREIGDDVVDIGLVRQAWKSHLGARHLGLGVLQIDFEGVGVPGDAGVFVGVRIVVAFNRPG